MLHRIKKENDENKGKWIGIGGGFENNESPEDCLLREIKEECGIIPTSYTPRGIVTFVSDEWGCEYMHLYTATSDADVNSLVECDEGVAKWVENENILSLPMWEGDKIFFDLIRRGEPFFSLKLVYKGENLVESYLNGTKL